MTQAEYIIEKAGGVTALSRMLGHQHRTTVQGWEETGFIPLRNWKRIMNRLGEHGIRITKEDFVAFLDLDEDVAA